MKKAFFSALLSLAAVTGFGIEKAELQKPEMPQHSHRMTVFSPNHLSYEYMANDDLYFKVDGEIDTAYDTAKDTQVHPAHFELKFGRTYFLNDQDHVRPVLGGGIYRDLRAFEVVEYSREFGKWLTVDELQNVAIGYGLIGVDVDHEFNSRLALGLSIKGIIGGPIGTLSRAEQNIFPAKSVYFGGDFSLPFMIRLGSTRNWELRLEPYALVINDGTRYIGHRSGVAYRF